MESDTLENLLTIRGMAREFLSGLMVEPMRDFGKTENKTVKVNLLLLMEKSSLEFGIKVKEKHGLMRRETQSKNRPTNMNSNNFIFINILR